MNSADDRPHALLRLHVLLAGMRTDDVERTVRRCADDAYDGAGDCPATCTLELHLVADREGHPSQRTNSTVWLHLDAASGMMHAVTQARKVHLAWPRPGAMPTAAAVNQMALQPGPAGSEGELTIVFGYVSAPIIPEDDPDPMASFDAALDAERLPIDVVGRFAVSEARLREFREVIDRTLTRMDEVRANVEESARTGDQGQQETSR